MSTIIVDIDGTVALHVLPDGTQLRGHHEYEQVLRDQPNWPVISLVKGLFWDGNNLLFVSGRPERARQDTIEWLSNYFPMGAYHNRLHMRADGDHRADDVVKEEIFLNLPEYTRASISLAIDDRPRVLRKWRELGIYAIDVQPFSGEF